MTDAFKDIEKLEADLWEAADNLRANSKLTSSDYFMPVLGVIFLRHAANRFAAAGMFVQSSHFIEHEGGDTAKKVVFYGQEKNRDTIRIAQMNLAVHGLEGKIAEAITYYQDDHNLSGKCDFVMANPPFNVDLVDAERIKSDPRLPFGLPGISKGNSSQKNADGSKRKGTVSNGNYLWISYFWSYLNEKGRAGFVMSSQASSAGHGARDVRKKIVETGDVDVMISIRSNFFYSRSVPCELWFFDRGKPPERKDKVLMRQSLPAEPEAPRRPRPPPAAAHERRDRRVGDRIFAVASPPVRM
jgi:type I restriction-modification system DNA methylase subunit